MQLSFHTASFVWLTHFWNSFQLSTCGYFLISVFSAIKKHLSALQRIFYRKCTFYWFPVSLYYSNSLVLPYVFWPLTPPAYFHRFLQFWYPSVQLLQEMCALCFGISHFYTFLNIKVFVQIILPLKVMVNPFKSLLDCCSSPFQKYLSVALKLQLITFYKMFTIFSFFSMVSYPHSGFQHSHCCFAGTAFSSYYYCFSSHP